ncbi:aminopeptidase [Prosthecobacter fusiformis]|uniref:aminopeptidase n=1 Tax=Prosthecobacter fusiformis TaxID=48464 RepID=UPI001414F9ED|nr:aminopeptidase [Prosthecobacter fusiformis]
MKSSSLVDWEFHSIVELMRHKGNNLETWSRLFSLIVGLTLTSCSTVGFYSQALQGQREISKKARPVSQILAEPSTAPILRQKLLTVRDLLAYAESELGLPAEGQYDRYANLGRRYVVWVIYAAPEFSTDAKRWWYPLVGNLKYRGFFKEAAAEKAAEKLRAEGLDVYLGGVSAYSTLGYLKDPLLNTFLGRADPGLAELIFHELTHQRIYLSGDTDFNEALATVVGREGARRWLRARKRGDDLEQYEKEVILETEFVHEALKTRDELEQLYARTDFDEAAMRQEKQVIIGRLKGRLHELNKRYGGSLKLDRWFEKPVNNARLNTLATYHDLVPAFETLLKDCHGDLELFLKRMESMKNMTPRERREAMKQNFPAP